MVTKLVADKAVLQLRTDEREWCEVELRLGNQVFPLGADLRCVIERRLRRGLAEQLEGTPVGFIQDVLVVWVLSLAERHTTVYAGNQNGRRLLFFQAADGSLLARIELSNDDRQRWIAELKG